jgi:hypothetical protein
LRRAALDVFQHPHIVRESAQAEFCNTITPTTDILKGEEGSSHATARAILTCALGPYHFPEKLIPHIIIKGLAEEPLPVYGDGQQIRD